MKNYKGNGWPYKSLYPNQEITKDLGKRPVKGDRSTYKSLSPYPPPPPHQVKIYDPLIQAKDTRLGDMGHEEETSQITSQHPPSKQQEQDLGKGLGQL